MKKVSILLVFCIGLLTSKTYSQISLGYYPFQSVLSVGTNTDNLMWVDFRIETNTFFSNVNFELDAMVNIQSTDWINYYLGMGINVNPFYGLENLPFTNGYVANFGVRIKPIQKNKNLQLIFELGPYFNQNFDGGIIRTLVGVSYNL